MPDITMCINGEECSKKNTCYRYKAISDKFQSYSAFYENNKKCKSYLKMNKKNKGDNI